MKIISEDVKCYVVKRDPLLTKKMKSIFGPALLKVYYAIPCYKGGKSLDDTKKSLRMLVEYERKYVDYKLTDAIKTDLVVIIEFVSREKVLIYGNYKLEATFVKLNLPIVVTR